LEFRISSYYKINLNHYAEKRRKVYHYRHVHELSLEDDSSFSFDHKEILAAAFELAGLERLCQRALASLIIIDFDIDYLNETHPTFEKIFSFKQIYLCVRGNFYIYK